MSELEFLWKDPNSDTGHCPALYKTTGGYVVQGKQLSKATREQVEALAAENDSPFGPDEDAIFVPDDVLNRLKGTT